MQMTGLRAHFDGHQIVLDEPFELKQDVSLIVLVMPEIGDGEAEEWRRLSALGLAAAYGEHEPEYSLDRIKEANPGYEAG